MIKPSDRAAAAALRKKAEAALKLDVDGRHEEAIADVDDLVASHEGSALVLHLAGVVHAGAVRRASRAGDYVAMVQHSHTSRGCLTKAKLLVPNCVAISAHLAMALFAGGEWDAAEKEAREAINMVSTVDPADNNVMYAVKGFKSTTTKDQRVVACKNWAIQTLSDLEHRRFLRLVREVLEFDTDCHDGAREAAKKAKEVAERYPSSSRAQLLSAHMQIQRVRVFDPDRDRRRSLDRIRAAMKEAIAKRFGSSLVFAMFHAKLCFVLGLYDAVHLECVRAFAIPEPVDPKLEDVPPDSIQGDTIDDRLDSVDKELIRLLDKLFLVAHDFRCSMTSEKQDSFLSVTLVELQKYYEQKYENYQWASQTISDALSFVNKYNSWRFWICPSCAGKKFPNPGSLLEHMNSKHLQKLRSVFGSKLSEYVIQDDYLDQITFYQDSEGHHFFRFNKTDYVFARLSLPTEEMSIAGVQEKICEQGKEILEEIKVKLNRLPADKLRAKKFDKACHEIQDLWDRFVRTSILDYRLTIMTFARPFIWTKLLQSLSENKAASKISNADIDKIFPNVVDICEVHAEDNVGRLEIGPNSNIADVQSASGLKYLPVSANENSSSDLLGTLL
uniref:Uncharacterized protein n=1 Tax=Avena sativa TaxID=4498 RepID=A0ACD5X1U4_AVESA